ncbi:MAG TPA: tRNA epoxyqueuosine(34) reductase QueG [Thermoanaerobaculia bacterium]|nr:tRNA epoxyqueuosine(34) reductase QueG [Thermoanaerobaculia bacterium]
MNSTRRTALVRAWALEQGFDRVGIARLDPLPHGPALLAWLERGDQAGMEWMGRRLEARLDPSQALPGARVAICVALQYHPPEGAAEPAGDLWPRVARYARGLDYHNVMGERLAALGDRLREAFPGTESRFYVDTGPVLERELAARAGLGAVGKHSLLLNPEGGSWFLLGELFTTLDLDPGEPLTDLCGRCRLCLDACPTGALPEPYRLDSRRCISYWTIEHRGSLPEEAREMLGEWVFGCDVCQEVCPWNRGPRRRDTADEAFQLPSARAELDLAGLLGLGREDYVESFRGSPLKRAKLSGLKRNAAVVMGNRGDPRYVPALERALEDQDPVVREHAAWALGRIGGPEALRVLVGALEREGEPSVRAELGEARARLTPPPAAPILPIPEFSKV